MSMLFLYELYIGIFQDLGRRGIINRFGKENKHTHDRLFGRYGVMFWPVFSRSFSFFYAQVVHLCYSLQHILSKYFISLFLPF